MSDYKTPSGNEVYGLRYPIQEKGAVSSAQQMVWTNPKTYTLTRVRVALQLTTGVFEDGTAEQGQELQDEKWAQVRRVDPVTFAPIPGENFVSIGGPFGLSDDDPAIEEGSNYLPLPDLAPGESVGLEVRIAVPVDADTERIATARFIVAWFDPTAE